MGITTLQWLRGALVLLAVVAAQPVSAAVILLNLTGTITSVNGALLSEFSVGESLSGTVSFDTGLLDTNPAASARESTLATDASLNFGDYAVTGTGGKLLLVNDPLFDFVDLFTGTGSGVVAGAAVGAFVLTSLQVLIQDLDATVFASDTPPAAAFTDLSQFENRFARLGFTSAGGDPVFVTADISAPPQQVAEPGSFALLALGFALALARRRTKT